MPWMSIDDAMAGHRQELDDLAVRLGRTVDERRWRQTHHPGSERCEKGHRMPVGGICRPCAEVEARRARWRAQKRALRARMTPEELADWRRWRNMDLRAWRARRKAREDA